jgi:hypothetical protein
MLDNGVSENDEDIEFDKTKKIQHWGDKSR